ARRRDGPRSADPRRRGGVAHLDRRCRLLDSRAKSGARRSAGRAALRIAGGGPAASVDFLHNHGVGFLHHGPEASVSSRSPPRHHRPPDPALPSPRAEPRPRHREAHPAHLGRPAAGGNGLALPGALSARGPGLDRGLLGAVRQGQARPLLPHHPEGTEAADRRAVEMGGVRPCHGAAAEAARRGGRMTPFFRKVRWWLQRGRREAELREELEFHLQEEREARQAGGLSADEAAWAARRELGNATLLREDARALWSWVLLEQLAQDVRYGLRGMSKNRLFTSLAALSLALGIGANTAIYSFMDAILLASLPVADPASLVVVKWRSREVVSGSPFVMHAMAGSTYDDRTGVSAGIFPFPAFEQLQTASAPALSRLFAHKEAGGL